MGYKEKINTKEEGETGKKEEREEGETGKKERKIERKKN